MSPDVQPIIARLPEAGLTLKSRGERATKAMGETLGKLLRLGDLLLLEGPLGAGKTRLVQGIALGLGIRQTILSPTFTLVRPYRIEVEGKRADFYHIDLYRIATGDEAVNFGLEEYFGPESICAVEWADRTPSVWPLEHLRIRLELTGSRTREVASHGTGERYVGLVQALEMELW